MESPNHKTPSKDFSSEVPARDPQTVKSGSNLSLLLIVLVLLLTTLTGILVYQNNFLKKQISQLQNQPQLQAQQLEKEILDTTQNNQVIVLSTPNPQPTADPTAGWEKYSNTKYAFDLMHPKGMKIFNNGIRGDEYIGQSPSVLLGDSTSESPVQDPHIQIQVLDKSIKDFGNLSEIISQNHTSNSSHTNKITNIVHTNLNSTPALKYNLTTQVLTTEYGESSVLEGNYQVIYLDHNGNIIALFFLDNDQNNQILSTFQFAN